MILSLYFIFFLVWFILNYRNQGFNASSFLILIYLGSSFAALILMYGYKSYEVDRISIVAVSFHILCLTLFLTPIIKIGNVGIEKFKLPNIKILKRFCWFLIILSCVSIVISSTNLIYVLSHYELAVARALHNRGELYPSHNQNIFTYLGGIGQHFSLIALFMAFYVYVFYPKEKLLFILLFISSFGVVMQNLSIVGRDGIIRWLLFAVFVYSLFKNFISVHIKRKILRIVGVAFLPLAILFIQISNAKFYGVGRGVFYFFIDYIGQPFIYFSYNFHQFLTGAAGGRMSFPTFFPGQQVSINNLNDKFYANYNLNTFPTFIGSFYIDLGLLKTLTLAMFFFLFFIIYFHKTKIYSFSKLIVYIILYEIVILGVFYYMFNSTEVINTFIFIICISIFIDSLEKKTLLIRKKKFQ